MKLNQILLPTLALTVSGLFVLPSMEVAQAFNLNGTKLNQGQRDFRIFNNFTDSAANNNNTPDPMFPGYQGAVMAIWKGCVEWGSRSHGDGSGDPTQSNLGDGGANFDAAFQGLATGVGDGNDNIHSEISGGAGGVLAFAELNGGNGWRIRYYRSWNWLDGPGAGGGGGIDLQGVSCHEYGHVLGMGHSGNSGATMAPSISGNGSSARSINGDDIAGIQAAYGVHHALKPIISSMTIVGSSIQITGSAFDPTGNEIWFTQSSAGGDGIPIKATGLTSNGTFLSATIPAAAGPGDILVRRDGFGNFALSNAMPTDLVQDAACPTPTNYCSFQPNSAGLGAQISSLNDPSLVLNSFTLTGQGLPPNKVGLFFYGPNQTNSPFGDGLLCVSGSITRLPAQVSDVLGLVDLTVDFSSDPFDAGNGQAIAGETMNFQFWYRDPAFGVGFNTTDGLSVTFCP